MSNTKDYGIVIGIQHYVGNVEILNGPHADTENFYNWLNSKTGGDIPLENLKRLLSTPTYTPLKDEVDDWFLELIKKFRVEGRGRRLYFYFSGHGIGSSRLNSAMLLPKWEQENRNYALSSEKYLNEIIERGIFEEIFFIMDCCRNRIAKVEGQGPTWNAVVSDKGCEHITCYASEFQNPAHEAVFYSENGTLDNGAIRGLFTEVILNAFSGGAADINGWIKIPDFVNYVMRELPALSMEKIKKSQIPKNDINFDLQKNILGPFSKTATVEIEFKEPGIEMILEDTELKPIKTGNSSEGKWIVEINRKQHWIRRLDDVNDPKKKNITIKGIITKVAYE